MRYVSAFSSLALVCSVSMMSASPITYDVTVNTSSISGTAGSLDFNFNPGLSATQSASLQVLSFASDGTLENCAANFQGFCPTGDVTGTLPSTLTFDNGTAFNDYFDDFTYGNSISFAVSLYGPALSAPDGISTSGSTFAFSMFSDAAGTVPALTTDTTNGFAVTVNVNLDGTTTLTNSSTEATVTAVASSTPEPGTWSLMALVLALWFAFRFRPHKT